MNIHKKSSFSNTSKSFLALLILFSILILTSAFWAADTLTTPCLPKSGQPAALYSNQTRDDLKSTLVAGINEAKQSILLIIYSLTDKEIIQALCEQAEKGVSITVICDPNASTNAVSLLGTKINVVKRNSLGLMHQKILVIDGAQTWIGSANMTNQSLRLHGNLILGVHSPELAEKVLIKAERMQQPSPQPPCEHCELKIAGQETELWFLPDDTKASSAVLKLIETAQKTIRVAMFTFTRYDFAKALIAAQKRGVDTKVVVDAASGKGASSKIVNMLKKGKVPVALSQNAAGLLHHKFMYIDGSMLVNGSANWTYAAFTKNDDCFMILRNLTKNQHDRMEALWEVIHAESEKVK